MLKTDSITVYVGDVTEYLANKAKSADPSAQMLNGNNYENLSGGTYYVSIGDLNSLGELGSVLRQADVVVYVPPETWSDEKKKHSQMRTWTEEYLWAFADKKPIHNFDSSAPEDKSTMLKLVDQRCSDKPQLWVAGCSFTFGIGVEKHERYGELLANKLNLPVSFLAWPGSSVTWAADQILRSDIRAGDVVVWGLTAIERFPYFKNNKVTHFSARAYEHDDTLRYKVDISFLDSQQLVYQAVQEIHQVINFCKKAGAQLVLAQVHGRGLERYLKGNENYIMLRHQHGRNLSDIGLDLGNDGEHPGPAMHQWYADQILKKYTEVYKNE